MQSVTAIAAILLFVIKEDDAQQITATICGHRISEPRALMINAFNASYFPWHAAIYHKDRNSIPQYKCGGTVIDSLSILTAAHCVSRYNKAIDAAKVLIYLGKLNLDVTESSSQSFEADRIILHSNYSSIDYNNDIAIIRLSKNATFNNYVVPICLWNSSKTNLSEVIGSAGTVIGWGRTESAEKSDVLRQALMPVVDPVGCLISNRDFVGSILSKTNFCAGSRNGTSICDGDSGGSMTFEINGLFYIRGIVSVTANVHNETTQQSMCDPTQFAIFTDVAQYLPWINNHVDNHIECVNKVRCDYEIHGDRRVCQIFLHINHSERKCKIIVGDDTDTNRTTLRINGELTDLPDAINKFEKLTTLRLIGVHLETVARVKLAAFRSLQFLFLSENKITELAADTFDDLKDLSRLYLTDNKLKTIHRDVFHELHNLEIIFLDGNQLEVLPEGLFRNNRKLEGIWLERNKIKVLHRDVFQGLYNLTLIDLGRNQLEVLPDGLFRNNQKLVDIWLQENKLRKIECNFYDLPNLRVLALGRNVCIDELCYVQSFCGTSSLSEMHTKIWSKCPNYS